MREYTTIFRDGLGAGLRSNERSPKNTQVMVHSDGAYSENRILRTLDVLDKIDTSELDCSFPFPQILKLKQFTLVCTETAIYEYRNSVITLLLGELNAGSTWTYADYEFYIVMTNGAVMVIRDPQTGTWAKYVGCEIPNGLCVCNLNGQLLIGGHQVTISNGFLG